MNALKTNRKYLWAACGVALIFYLALFHYQAEQKEALRAAEAKAAQAVSVLPHGVEEIWIGYIEKRIGEEIQHDGNNLKVRTTSIGSPPNYAYLSLNHPYQIDCNSYDLGISVNFGTNESDSSAHITGMFSPDYKNEPERGVSPGSIAYKNLDQKLCQLVADRLSDMIDEEQTAPEQKE